MSDLRGMAAHVARRVARLMSEEPTASLRARPFYSRPVRDLGAALKPGAKVVEIVFAEPERGLLVPREKVSAEEAAARAATAAASGAAAVAIWCERNFHAGDWAHLEAARAACPDLPLIARDVVVDAWQLERARAAGADAIELLPELLGTSLGLTAAAAREIGLTPLAFRDGAWRLVA